MPLDSILIKRQVTGGAPWQDPVDDRIGGYDYYCTYWVFSVATKAQPVPTTGTERRDFGEDPVADYDWDGEFWHECLAGSTTRKGYVHDGNGGYTNTFDFESTECGFDPGNPDPDPDPDPDPTPDPDPEPVPDPEPAERIAATAPPALAVVGLPLLVTLASVPTGRAAAHAQLDLAVGVAAEVSGSTALVVNGESFRGAVVPNVATDFADADTLAQALAGSDVLSSRYRVTLPAADQVRLVAKQAGTTYNLSAACSDTAVTITRTPGADEWRSQTKADWGCYLEVWRVPGAVFGEPVDKGPAELVERLEQLYTTGNAYTFDLAPSLRGLVDHARPTTADRLVAYFVRFGEVFRPTGSTVRRRFVQADSDVCWALEGAVPVPAYAQTLNLSTPPPRWVLPKGRPAYAERLTALAPAGAPLRLELQARYFDGSTATHGTDMVAAGGVEAWPIGPLLLASAAGAKGWPLYAAVRLLAFGEVLAEHRVLLVPAGPADRCLVLCSRRGTYETLWLRGLPDPSTKRTPQLYNRGRAQAVRSVVLEPLVKLQSSRLDPATYAWLDELAAAPLLYLFDTATGEYTDVLATGYAPAAKPEEHDYSFTLDVVPATPAAVLTA
jgi:hypothetical protein